MIWLPLRESILSFVSTPAGAGGAMTHEGGEALVHPAGGRSD